MSPAPARTTSASWISNRDARWRRFRSVRYRSEIAPPYCNKPDQHVKDSTTPQRLEPPRLIGDSRFDWQPLDAAGAEEASNAVRMVEDILRIFRFGDWPAVAQDQQLGIDRNGCVAHSLHSARRFVERHRRLGA